MKPFWLPVLNSCKVVKTRPAFTIIPVIHAGFVSHSSNGFTLSWWSAPASGSSRVDYARAKAPAWTTFSNIITSTDGSFRFTDDGLQNRGLGSSRFYRLRIQP